jgi:hypothetical protein
MTGRQESDVAAAFTAIGAPSQAASYQNIMNPGTNDAAPGTEPSWDAAEGWDFELGSSQYLVVGSGAIITSAPLTLIALVKTESVATYLQALAIRRTDANHGWQLYIDGITAGDKVAFQANDAGGNTGVTSSIGVTNGAWCVISAVATSVDSRTVYLNGGSSGSSSTSRTPSGVNITLIGANHNGTALAGFFDGRIGACAYYNVALSASEIQAIGSYLLSITPTIVATIDENTEYQTWDNWQAHAESYGLTNPLTGAYAGWNVKSSYPNYIADVLAAAVDFGINHVNIPVASNVENATDYFAQVQDGTITIPEYNSYRNYHDNDNADPNSKNAAGFIWDSVAFWMDTIVVPLRTALASAGITMKLSFNNLLSSANDDGWYLENNPDEYGEFILALYDYLQVTYGFVPDYMNFNEPPKRGSINDIWDSALAIQERLTAGGYTPKFLIPSGVSVGETLTYIASVRARLGDAWCRSYISFISYHRYFTTPTTADLEAIKTEADELSLPTMMNEWYDATVGTLIEDLIYGQVSSWEKYVLASTVASPVWHYFSIDVTDPDVPVLSYPAQTRYIRQLSHYIDTGSVRVSASINNDSIKIVSFLSSADKLMIFIYVTAAVAEIVINGVRNATYDTEYSVGNAPIDGGDKVSTLNQISVSMPAAGVMSIIQQ